jgi:hypothetical protein
MSKLEKDGLKDCLFSRQDRKLVNIKFFRGDRDIITAAEMRAELCSIARQQSDGLKPSVGPTHSGAEVINVRKLVVNV